MRAVQRRATASTAALLFVSLAGGVPHAAGAEFVRDLLAHRKPVSKNMSVAPQASRLATIGLRDDKTVFVWDTATGKAALGVESPTPLSRVVLTPDGKQVIAAPVVSGPTRYGLPRWSVTTGETLEPLRPTDDLLPYALSASPNGKYVAGFNGAKIWIWRLADAKIVFEKTLLAAGSSAVFTPDGRAVIVGSPNGIYQYALPGGQLLTKYDRGNRPDPGMVATGRPTAQMENATSLVVSPDGRHFAATFTMSQKFRIGYWQIGRPTAVALGGYNHQEFNRNLRSLQFSADGKTLIATSNFSGSVDRGKSSGGLTFSLPALTEGKRFHNEFERVAWTTASRHPEYLLTAGERYVRRWKISNQTPVGGFSLLAHEKTPAQIVPLAAGRAVSLGTDGTLCAWDTRGGVLIRTIRNLARETASDPLPQPSALGASADGKTLVFVIGNSLRVWDPTDLKERKKIPLGDLSPDGVQVDSDGSQAVCWQRDGACKIVSLTDDRVTEKPLGIGKAERIERIHRDLETVLVTSKLTNRDAVSSSLWDLSTGKKTSDLRSPKGTQKPIVTDAPGLQLFSADASSLVTSSKGGETLYFWNCENGLLERQLKVDDGVIDASYDTRGKLIAIIGDTLHTFDPDEDEFIDLSGDSEHGAGQRLVISAQTGEAITADKRGKLSIWRLKR